MTFTLPSDASLALIGFLGAVASAVTGYLVAERRLRAEHSLKRALGSRIRELLEINESPARRFSSIKNHLKGLPDDEIRRSLVEAGAISMETDGGEEVWGLAYRLKRAVAPVSEAPFTLVPVMYSTTAPADAARERLKGSLKQIQETSGTPVLEEAQNDMLEFLGDREGMFPPTLSVQQDGAIRAKWANGGPEPQQVNITFPGGGVVQFKLHTRLEHGTVRTCSGTDTIAGVIGLLRHNGYFNLIFADF